MRGVRLRSPGVDSIKGDSAAELSNDTDDSTKRFELVCCWYYRHYAATYPAQEQR